MRLPRTTSGRPLSVPLSATALATPHQLQKEQNRLARSSSRTLGPHTGGPVFDIKNRSHTARELAGLENIPRAG